MRCQSYSYLTQIIAQLACRPADGSLMRLFPQKTRPVAAPERSSAGQVEQVLLNLLNLTLQLSKNCSTGRHTTDRNPLGAQFSRRGAPAAFVDGRPAHPPPTSGDWSSSSVEVGRPAKEVRVSFAMLAQDLNRVRVARGCHDRDGGSARSICASGRPQDVAFATHFDATSTHSPANFGASSSQFLGFWPNALGGSRFASITNEKRGFFTGLGDS